MITKKIILLVLTILVYSCSVEKEERPQRYNKQVVRFLKADSLFSIYFGYRIVRHPEREMHFYTDREGNEWQIPYSDRIDKNNFFSRDPLVMRQLAIMEAADIEAVTTDLFDAGETGWSGQEKGFGSLKYIMSFNFPDSTAILQTSYNEEKIKKIIEKRNQRLIKVLDTNWYLIDLWPNERK